MFTIIQEERPLTYVLDDISLDIKCVYMPSYCCDSMLQPFLEKRYPC